MRKRKGRRNKCLREYQKKKKKKAAVEIVFRSEQGLFMGLVITF